MYFVVLYQVPPESLQISVLKDHNWLQQQQQNNNNAKGFCKQSLPFVHILQWNIQEERKKKKVKNVL